MKYSNFEKKLAKDLTNVKEEVDTGSLIKNLERRGILSGSSNSRLRWLWLLVFALLFISIYPIYLWVESSWGEAETNIDHKETSFSKGKEKLTNDLLELKTEEVSNAVDKRTGTNRDIRSEFTDKPHPQSSWEGESENITPVSTEGKGRSPKKNIGSMSLLQESFNDEETKLNTSMDAKDLKDKKTLIYEESIVGGGALNSPPLDGPNIYFCPVLDFDILSYQLANQDLPLLSADYFKKIGDGCANFGNYHTWRLDIIPEIGMFRPIKSLQSLGMLPNEAVDIRRENERSLEGIQLGVYGRLTHNYTNLYFQIGGTYTRLSERLTRDYSYIRTDTTTGIISLTVSQSGDTITTIYGDIYTQTEVSGSDRVHHYHNVLDIPLMVGYDFDARIFNVGIEAGVSLNLYLLSRGRILNNQLSFDDVTVNNPFRANLGLTYLGGLNVSRRLGRGSAYLSLRYRHTPASYSSDESNFQQFYNQVGLNLGYIIPLARW